MPLQNCHFFTFPFQHRFDFYPTIIEHNLNNHGILGSIARGHPPSMPLLHLHPTGDITPTTSEQQVHLLLFRKTKHSKVLQTPTGNLLFTRA